MSKPVDKFQEGSISVAIFENDGPRGSFRTATVQLRYKKDGEWKTGNSFGPKDLEALEKAAREARQRIMKTSKAKPDGTQPA